MTSSPAVAGRYLESLSYADYRRLFLSTSGAGLANWTLIVGRGWLAYELTASSTWVGVVSFAGFLPFVLGPIGGVLADRYERRRLAAASTAFGFAFSLLLAVLTLAGAIEAWQLALLTVAMSLPRAAELPARQALISNTVPEAALVNAVSLSSVATFGTRAVGPAVVIPMIDTLGVEGVFLLAAGFYALSSLAVLRIGASVLPGSARRSTALEDLREGLAYVLHTPSVATLMLLVMFHCALTMSFDSLLPVFAVQRLESHGGANFSMLAMGVGAGALAGSLYTGGIRGASAGRMLLLFAVVSGLSPMLMGLPMHLMSLPVALAGTFTMGASQAAFMALCGAMVQSAAPDALRGRVMSFYLLFAGGLMAWVNLINGALADIWHVPLLFLAPAALYLALLAGMYVVRLPLRHIFRDGRLAAVRTDLVAVP
ncbi:MAG TPA: MFS transporter [Dehalococcoidia bacterium]|nr:MFS transporter [Dehalococcoidia bacterium]